MFDLILSALMRSHSLYQEVINKTASPQNEEDLSQAHHERGEDKTDSKDSEFARTALLHDVSVAIPFRCYSITLKHRLIDSLGGVSRFLLTALTQENASLETIKKITALTDEHLEPFITRFIRLGWMTDDCTMLTPKGRAIAHAALMVDQTASVWIDSTNTPATNPIILLSNNNLQATTTDGAVSLTPTQQRKARNAKHQKERIEKFFVRLDKARMTTKGEKRLSISDTSYTKFLISIFERKGQVIIDNAADWYFDVDVKDEEMSYFMTTLPKGTPFDPDGDKNDGKILFALPCLTCDIRFDQQSRRYFDVPDDRNLCLSLHSGALIEKHKVMLNDPYENFLGVCVDDEYCKAQLEKNFPSCSPLASRTVDIETGFYAESISIESIFRLAEKESMPWGRDIIKAGGDS